MTPAERVPVELGQRRYDIVVGQGLLGTAGRHLKPMLARPLVAIVTDAVVADLHLPTLQAGLAREGIACETVVLPHGETSKSLAVLELLLDRLLEARIERRDLVLALGGGVVGDLAGFATSILRRGTGFVQLPTTLLAQVDSSVGGKTGVNTKHGKNLIGSFHQPRLVLADVEVLDSLPRRALLAGYAEVVKYGLINDAAFFGWLERHGQALVEGDLALRRQAVVASCRAKAAIVVRDEREDGERALLNLGHTFGHALEAEAGYSSALLHGEAVAAGLALAFQLSVRLGLCPAEDAARVRRHLALMDLPAGAYLGQLRTSAARLYTHMLQDKKVRNGRMTFVLARGIGQSFLSHDVPETAVLELLEEELAG